ncbi:hypothetical protein BH11PSE8_BH11PSE8_46330 [soil metagenome]
METSSRDEPKLHTFDQVFEAERRWLFPEQIHANGPGAGTAETASTQAPSTRAGDAADEIEMGAVPDVRAAAPAAAEPLSALCLSGGGIRSATFCLGVLQGLAAKELLRRYHYLSTVSGGGYIGCWLSGWIMRAGFEKVLAELATGGPEVEPWPVRRLRAYTNYLSPVWGLSTDFLALMAIFVRNLALHWCVMLPLIAAGLMLPRLQVSLLQAQVQPGTALAWLVVAAVLLVMAIAYFVADLPGDPPAGHDPKDRFIVACFLPLLASAVIFSWIGIWQPGLLTAWGGFPLAVGGAAAHFLAIVFGLAWRKARELPFRQRHRTALATDAFFVFASGAVGGLLLYGAACWAETHRPSSDEARALYATLSVPALLIIFWVGVTAYSGLANRITSEDDREWWARSAAWWLGAGFAWLLGATLVIYLPLWLLGLPWLQKASGPSTVGIGAALLSIVTGAVGYWSKNGATVKQKAKGFIEASGVGLLDLAALVSVLALLLGMSFAVSYGLQKSSADIASRVTEREAALEQKWAGDRARGTVVGDASAAATGASAAPAPSAASAASAPTAALASAAYQAVMMATPWHVALLVLAGLVALGVTASGVTGINTFSLHSMYGNRLARAYLGASNLRRRPHWFIDFDPLDNPKLAGVTRDLSRPPGNREAPERAERRLFPVINVALNLVKASADRLEWQQRKAASFTMTPLSCGSTVLAFAPTDQYGDGGGGVSLGRAMAISGAAASPNMGYHTSTLVAFVMTFFNIRLGWWMPNPRNTSRKVWEMREPRSGLEPLLAEAGAGTTADRDFVYLSDGGHFENLGLYEMVRRGCRDVVVIDASCDPEFTFEDLHGAIRKVRIDFGIPITFDEPLPTPEHARKTGRHVAIGKIEYDHVDPLVKPGRLVYVKPVLCGNEPLDVERYAAANNKLGKAFPHQTTADQFFDEAQFESYRMLGQHIAQHNAFTDEEVKRDIKKRPDFGGGVVGLRQGDSGKSSASDDPPDRRWWSGMSDGMQSLNQSALMAAAVTLGGVVGVTGSIALKDGSEVQIKPGTEISLAQSDRDLLTRGMPLVLPAAQIERLVGVAGDLRDASSRQTNATNGLSNAVTGLTPSAEQVAQLDRRLEALDTSLQAVAAAASAAKGDTSIVTHLRANTDMLTQTRTAIQELKTLMASPRHDDAAKVIESMGNIGKKLDSIDAKIQDSTPRRNIRGVTEGGTR